MSIPEAFGAPYEITVGEQKLVFSLLPMGSPLGPLAPSSIAAVMKVVEVVRRNRLKSVAMELGLSKESAARHIAIGESEALTIYHAYDYAGSYEGAFDVAGRSLKLSGLTDAQIAEVLPKINPITLQEIGQYVTGCIVQKKTDTPANPNQAGGESTGNATAGL